MLVLRNLRNLTKITQHHVTAMLNQPARRELRRLQLVEFQVVPKTPETETNSVEFGLDNSSTQERRLYNTTSNDSNNKLIDASNESAPSTTLAGDKDKEPHSYVPTFNLAAYVNKSPTLQQFLKLGVDLSSIERRKGLAEFVLRLRFEEDVRPYLLFLQDQGVAADAFGLLITKNPLLFKVELDDLQTRVNYMEAKRFTPQQRSRVLTLNPFWLMFSTARIDRRLGHFQQEFRLSGDDVRFLAAKLPRLVTYNMDHVRAATFCIREEMGFDADELKCLLLSKPRLWMLKSNDLIERFAYAHNEMQLSHDMLIKFPEVLTSREFRLRQRHEFLKMLGRAQYDPEQDLYVSPRALVEGTDRDFAQNVAKSDMQTYELFLRTR